jgi:hypothetical protein
VVTSVGAILVVPIACSKNRWLPWCRAVGHQDVDDLPELVDGAVDMAPPAGDLHLGLVHGPAISHTLPAGPSRVASSGVNRSTHR